MFYYLVLSCTGLALFISLTAMLFFSKPIKAMLSSVLPSELSLAWETYMRYMIIVVGVGGGVSIYRFKNYLESSVDKETPHMPLTSERWALELYETLLDTLTSIGWLMFWFFLAVMIAYVILKVRKKDNLANTESPPANPKS